MVFETGKVYGIVGENGAGKTTLFRCIAGLDPFTGSVQSLVTPLKDHLGFLQTEPYFIAKITGFEYLQLLSNARGTGRIDFDLLGAEMKSITIGNRVDRLTLR